MQSNRMAGAAAVDLAVVTALAAHALPAREPAFDVRRVSADVRTLANDAFEGRAPGTRGEEKTTAFIIARMKAAGLSRAVRCTAGDAAGRRPCRSARSISSARRPFRSEAGTSSRVRTS